MQKICQMTKENFNFALASEKLNSEKVAFVKCDKVSNNSVWRLCAADGTELAVTDSRGLAFFVARKYDLVPQSVH